MRLTPRRYALTLIVTALVAFGAVVAANVLIDPQRMFGTELFPDKRNANDRYQRYVKYRETEPRVQGLLFASSRGGAIPLDLLSAHTGGTRFADFSVGFGLITDHLPVLERAIRDKAARGERLRHVFLMLDLDFLGRRPVTNRNPQSQLHPDLTGEDKVRFWVRYLTAIQFQAWWSDLRRASRPDGKRALYEEPEPLPLPPPPPRRLRLATLAQVPLAPMVLPAAREPHRVTTRHDYRHQLALVRRFVELCREHGAALTVALSPLQRAVADTFDPDDLAAAAADLARIAPLWDFGAPSWLSDRPELWDDISHFTPEVGRWMVERIATGALPPGNLPFGVRRPPAGP